MKHSLGTPRKFCVIFRVLSSCNYAVGIQSYPFLGFDDYVVIFEFIG